ncbi:MAG: hypothetical protein PWQ76_1156 [Clostridiales bacterium]|jgi:uncharacterized membrane protein YcaP (DUF421 family)|nr:putative rane protein [Oscillospiraceae bacterium]MDN5378901.1 hypothetical protein [Clostridiales bacterium]
MAVIFIRAVILYAVIVFAVRLMGKRQIGELQPSELVITILVSNIATLPVEDPSMPMLMGIIPIIVLVCLDVIMSGLTLKCRRLRTIVSGSPKIIIRDGVIDQEQMRVLRFSIDDLMESLHACNIFDISEVQFAIVETTGKVSVYQKQSFQPVSAKTLGIGIKPKNPPFIVIDDGILLVESLKSINRDMKWLEDILRANNVSVREVFLLSADINGKYTLIKKEKKKK